MGLSAHHWVTCSLIICSSVHDSQWLSGQRKFVYVPRNLEIALCILRILKLRTNLKITQSRDRAAPVRNLEIAEQLQTVYAMCVKENVFPQLPMVYMWGPSLTV